MVKILTRFLPRRRKPPRVITDAISLAATALRESADAFPPLKSAAGGVAHVIDLSRSVKSNQKEFQELARRTEEILNTIYSIAPSDTEVDMPADLCLRIDEFASVVERIRASMETKLQRKVWRRLVSHKEDAGSIVSFNRQLDDLTKWFTFFSMIKVEVTIAALEKDQGARLGAMMEGAERRHEDVVALVQKVDRQQKHLAILVLFD